MHILQNCSGCNLKKYKKVLHAEIVDLSISSQFSTSNTPFQTHTSQILIIEISPTVLSDIKITAEEVYEVLSTPDINKATGPDGISTKLLKNCSPSICSSLSSLFNKRLSVGKLPSEWRLSGTSHPYLGVRPQSHLKLQAYFPSTVCF